MKKSISVIILTYNEEKHISRCVNSLLPFANEIFVVDSFSNDRTVEIAESLGAIVYQNTWVNYATQFQWGIDNCNHTSDWLMRIDADEYILPELQNEIIQKLEDLSKDISGIYVKRRVYFKSKWIKRGGFYPVWLLRIWRKGDGYIEQRWMDEHIKLTNGKTINFECDLVDENMNDLTWWTQKHNNYATREAVDILNLKYTFLKYDEIDANLFGSQEERKRYLKYIYAKLPLFTRPFIYFHWRFFIKLGFLDGIQGLIWHFLQAFWYRFLVDAKIYEIEKLSKLKKEPLREILIKNYGIKL